LSSAETIASAFVNADATPRLHHGCHILVDTETGGALADVRLYLTGAGVAEWIIELTMS